MELGGKLGRKHKQSVYISMTGRSGGVLSPSSENFTVHGAGVPELKALFLEAVARAGNKK